MAKQDATEGMQGIQAVERAFEITTYLHKNGPSTVTEVTEALDYSSSTAHIHLKTLKKVGYVVQNDARYELGLRFLRNGIAVRNRRKLYHVAKAEIDKLAEETGEAVGLGVEENGQRVSIYNAKGKNAISDKAPIGEFTNMHWTALGKVLLAHRSPEYVRSVMDRYGMPTATENTITDVETLLDALEQVRERGYAIENEERKEKIRSVALPIRVNERTIGAISITGPMTRLTDEYIESELVKKLRTSADVIEVKHLYDHEAR